MTNPLEAWAAAKQAVEPLYTRAIALGYNVTANMRTEEGRETHVWFPVWRFDQPSEQARTFDTLDAVGEYLDRSRANPAGLLPRAGR
jgi:hypothetical protein